jgi:GTPase
VRFIDEVVIELQAGDGGNGSAAMRREKYRPLGGPAGGDGGNGGDVCFEASSQLSTLLDLTHQRVLRARSGEHGRGKDQYGHAGQSLVVRVPAGTQVFDAVTSELLADLSESGQRFIAAKGGKGGRGNLHFATPTDRAPKRAEEGKPGQRRSLRLELKLLADVGIVGFPNVGKSTLVAAISRARPKVADYPFTTLVPNLGVVSRGEEQSFVIADIPGIIAGAADGAGLGLRFLKHIERTRTLLYLVSWDPSPGRSLKSDLDILRRELRRFDQRLAGRPALIAVSKIDLPEVQTALVEFRRQMRRRKVSILSFSSATRQGLDELILALFKLLQANPITSEPRGEPLDADAFKRLRWERPSAEED